MNSDEGTCHAERFGLFANGRQVGSVCPFQIVGVRFCGKQSGYHEPQSTKQEYKLAWDTGNNQYYLG